MYELELIYEAMKHCDNDVHTAIETVAAETGMSESELLEIYDRG